LDAVLMPPVRRPDDGSGRAFRKALRTVEQREPSRPFEHADIVWLPERLTHDAGDKHRAIVGEHMLLVVEVSEEFLANEPPQMPRVSWSVYTGKSWEDALVGGAAPSVPVAKARAEALWRAFLGYKRA